MARILVVDDDDSFRKMLRATLVFAGHEVLDAADGRAALALFERSPSDLVITDLVMPDTEGIETIMTLRRQHPGVRIIAMSGGNRLNAEPQLTAALKLGARRTLAKPFSQEDLLKAVDAVLAELPH